MYSGGLHPCDWHRSSPIRVTLLRSTEAPPSEHKRPAVYWTTDRYSTAWPWRSGFCVSDGQCLSRQRGNERRLPITGYLMKCGADEQRICRGPRTVSRAMILEIELWLF